MDHEIWNGLEPHLTVSIYLRKDEALSMPESNFLAMMENADVCFSLDALTPALERYNQIKKKIWTLAQLKGS